MSLNMTAETFQSYANEGYNRIPLVRKVLADLDTPLSAYQKLADGAYSYLLESVHGGEKWGRYSIIGLPCKTVLKVFGHKVVLETDGQVIEDSTVADPLAYVEEFQSRFRVPKLADLPRFNGGLVGFFAYDTVRYIEPKLGKAAGNDPLGTPDILLMVSDEVVVFDNLQGSLYLICHVDPATEAAFASGQARLDNLIADISSAAAQNSKLCLREVPELSGVDSAAEAEFVSGFKQADFEAAVKRIKEYVLAGDVMQTVISQRMSIPFAARPLDLYRALRFLNPSPYLYYMNLAEFYVVGSSPEILARSEGGIVSVRPIAGTRRRGRSEEEDKAMEEELLADPKERAEHLMLIDLGRNDVGRIAKTGSVKVTENMVVERYSHVMHIVSNVDGELQEGKTPLDVLRATFPAGTLSGAPKIRAMEIIDELEPVKRGVYGGAVGYLTWHGDMDTAIAIRTAVIKDQVLHIQAGAGIVADSVPELEWQETMNKGRAIFQAVDMVNNSLSPETSAVLQAKKGGS